MSAGSKRVDRTKGSIAKKAWRQVLPALVALAPVPVLGALSSASTRGRQGERQYQRITEGNRYALDLSTPDASAAEDGFAAFAVTPATSNSQPLVAQDDRALRKVLAGDSFQALKEALGSSRVSGRTPAARARIGTDSGPLGGFAGKQRLNGVCSTLFSVCTSDVGNLCTSFGGGAGDAQCTGARPPTVTLIALNGSPAATATSITFTVRFDEKPVGVTTDDFQVTTVSGTATGTVSSVVLIPGPEPLPERQDRVDHRFTVTVNGISGNGTIRLDLKANTNIIDVNPQFGLGAGGPFGNGNLGFTAAFSVLMVWMKWTMPNVVLNALNLL